jgi:hypothetical protein
LNSVLMVVFLKCRSQMSSPIVRVSAAIFSLTMACVVGLAQAATNSNTQSPLGTNLAGVSYWTSEIPFLDIFKTNAGFSTVASPGGPDTNEEKYLNLDSNGWPISLTAVNEPQAQTFTALSVLLLRNLPNTPNGNYPAGQYVVRYSGEGTLVYNFDAVKVSSTPGRDVINVANPSWGGGILVTITSTDPNHTGNYIRNIQVVKAEQENALIAGQIFNPAFLQLLQNFRTLRFMDWFATNSTTLSSWSNRPLTTNASWATSNGVPYEVVIALANAVSADAWINIPHIADSNFVQQAATLVHQQLGSTQKVYVEFSNEVWNAGFPQYAYANAQGRVTWPTAGSSADYGNNWYGMKVAQTCDTWKSVWGSDASRVVCVMGAQAANPWTATEALSCTLWASAPCSGHGIGAIAIAPYFGGSVPASWTSQSDGGLASFFTSLTSQNDPSVPVGGYIGQAVGWVAAYSPVTAKYGLPLVAYEGGQGFVDVSSTAVTNLDYAANRDPRMQGAYLTYLQGLKSNGMQLFMNFTDVQTYSVGGQWGALESIMQTTSPLSSAPPKWQALQNYITSTPCWWPNCQGTVASTSTATPMAPTNLSVH